MYAIKLSNKDNISPILLLATSAPNKRALINAVPNYAR